MPPPSDPLDELRACRRCDNVIMVDYPVHQPNRVAAIKDAWENQWWIATHVGDEELRRRVKAARGLRADSVSLDN